MTYRVLVNSDVLCSTAKEAFELSQLLAGQTKPHENRPDNDSWGDFLTQLIPKDRVFQRKLLALIKGREEAGITFVELAQMMGLRHPRNVGRILSGLRTSASKAGLDSNDVVIERNSRLFAGRLLSEHEPPEP